MRRSISLDGAWLCRADPSSKPSKFDATGFQEGINDFRATGPWEPCRVPSVWNLHKPEYMRYFGTFFYRRSFSIGHVDAGERVFLKFGAVNYTCIAWVNGNLAGRHDGGYTSFSFEITNHARAGEVNEILVYVDNSWGVADRLPWTRPVDWFNYGGIHQGVTIEIIPETSIQDVLLDQHVEFAGEGEWPSTIQLVVTVAVEGDATGTRISASIVPRHGRDPVAEGAAAVEGNAATITLNLNPATTPLWSPDNPALHDARVALVDRSGGVVDLHEATVGFRTFETRGCAFFLNNRRFFMKGTNRHCDHPSFGLAIPGDLIHRDLVLMKSANINCFRGSHYPNPECTLDACDELGLLFIEEIPAWQLQPVHFTTPGILEAAKQCFDEMHRRDKNHPCLVAWSLSNETHTDTAEGRTFHEQLYAHARAVDRGHHMIIHVSNKGVRDRCHDLSDFITLNIYNGWYGASIDDFPPQVRLIHEILQDEDQEFGPPRPIVITEFGAGAIRGYRSLDQPKWSEDFQATLLRRYIGECMDMDFVGGTWTWMFSDTRVDLPTRPDGRPRSYNNKGMIDEHRVPKLGYDAVKELYGKWGK